MQEKTIKDRTPTFKGLAKERGRRKGWTEEGGSVRQPERTWRVVCESDTRRDLKKGVFQRST